ncbi:hypothetical protein SAMN04515667_2311 [Formosa sp. Hel1_31_208]|uniref:hypothetical protein n=1 Tax=Formosa sp. Hel1_31_208 TaxID=1798225 RepID=UPI00087BFBC0|nr:hypothetical protein [Formosa sp. Hel1_31_208]SDS49856.1 hypothetical protein SAMN04515667_2311 [Formosa sp. Hel1_31_208]
MKKFLFLLLFSTFFSFQVKAQSISCQELFETVTEYYSNDSVTCLGSTMLVKVEYYKIEGNGFVVAYIKSNAYDFNGSPYIFCGISQQRWSAFKTNGMYGGSWGESFHEYIRDYTCNCY